MTTGVLCPTPILQFFGNNGEPNVGGSILTQIGGVNTATFQDVGLLTPLPNPIPLNSRGEVSNAAGLSCQLFLTPNTVYSFTMFDQFGNQVDQASYVNGVQFNLTQAGIAGFLTPQTVAEIAANITPVALQYDEGDIRRYGALTTATDNSIAINNALSVSASGGNAAYIPGGTWPITSTITPINSCSMMGAGAVSVILPTGCDGITFATGQAAYAASRFFRDFGIQGTSATTSTYNGINVNLSVGKIIGIQFSNLTIQNMQNAVIVQSATGLWNSAFVDCFFYNCYQGYYLNGQVSYLHIRGGFCQTGTMTGTGTKYGIFTGITGGGNVQSLHVQGHANYGFDVACYLNFTIEAQIEHCDFSIWNVNGVQIGTINGGPTVVRDCWLQAQTVVGGGSVAIIGINIIDRAVAVYDHIIIDGNNIQGNAGASTVGIYCGTLQSGVAITNNNIGNASFPFVNGTYGVSGVAQCPNLVFKNNTIWATTMALGVGSSATNAEIGPNTILNGTTTISGPPTGLMYRQPGMTGTASLTSGTSFAVALSVPLPGYQVMLSQGATSVSPPFVTSKLVSGFQINFTAAYTGTVDWEVRYG